jgi:nicotinate phosphoribosyltransferase
MVELLRGGEVVATDLDLQSARQRHERAMSELPPRARRLSRGEPAIPTLYENIRG